MGNKGQLLTPAFGSDELKRIAEILGKPKLSKNYAERFQRAALMYEFMAGSDPLRATRAQRRKAFKRVEKAALELKDAIGSVALMFIDDKLSLPMSDTRFLAELAKKAREAAKRVPPTAPDPEQARTMFVRDLASIYMDVIKRKPTRIAKYEEGYFAEESGVFRELVVASLEPLNPDALKGINDLIRKVVREISHKA